MEIRACVIAESIQPDRVDTRHVMMYYQNDVTPACFLSLFLDAKRVVIV